MHSEWGGVLRLFGFQILADGNTEDSITAKPRFEKYFFEISCLYAANGNRLAAVAAFCVTST